jgi:hypothetical protein
MDAKPSKRVGLPIVQAWLEGPYQRLIARITETLDVVDQPARVLVVGTAEEVYEAVQEWLNGSTFRETPERRTLNTYRDATNDIAAYSAVRREWHVGASQARRREYTVGKGADAGEGRWLPGTGQAIAPLMSLKEGVQKDSCTAGTQAGTESLHHRSYPGEYRLRD